MEKYLFENSFDVDPPLTPAEQAFEPPVYSEEELAVAQSESFAKGKAQGQETALEGIEQTTAAALSAIAARLEAVAAELAEVNERRGRQSLQAAVTILRKLFPELARRHGLDEIEAAIAACLERLHDEPRVVIRTADSLLDRLAERIDPIAEACGFAGKVVLLSDDALSLSEVRIEWADGGAERDTGRLWQEVDQILADALAPRPAETGSAAEPTPPRKANMEDSAIAEAGVEDPSAEDNAAAGAASNDPAAMDNADADGKAATPATDHNVAETVT